MKTKATKEVIEQYKKKAYYPHLCHLTHLTGRQYQQLVLYVLYKQEELDLTDNDIAEILRLIIVFAVKRNIMDNPAPRRFKSALYCMNQNIEKGIIKKQLCGVKVLGNGELEKKLTIKAHRFSSSAVTKIESAGGKAEVI